VSGVSGPGPVRRATRARRLFLGAGAALGLVACSAGRLDRSVDARSHDERGDDPRDWLADTLTIDMHSHAGRVIVSRDPAIGANRPFTPVSATMREGGMNVICLAIVTDTFATRVSADGRRFEPYRMPAPGELYQLSKTEFARAAALVADQRLDVATDAQSLRAARRGGPAVIIAAEGADFLEDRIERLDEAHALHRLRHLQLTHYRVNELGDIQTEAAEHGGLSPFGADVVRRCNALGIVVDVAHGSLDLVKQAAALTSRPLVLSHTALSNRPGPRSRLISPEHARVIAGTGGVIGVWPSAGSFADLDAMAAGVRRMVDVVGVDHVGLGTDMLGFITPPVFTTYRQLPRYAQALVSVGFSRAEVGRILGGNYLRVFEASVG
jgi:membrane dipeptidase